MASADTHHFVVMVLNICLWIFLINAHWVKTICTKRVLSWVNWRCLWEGFFFFPLGSRKPWRLIENGALKDSQPCSSFTIVGQSFDLHCFQSYLTSCVNENMFLHVWHIRLRWPLQDCSRILVHLQSYENVGNGHIGSIFLLLSWRRGSLKVFTLPHLVTSSLVSHPR